MSAAQRTSVLLPTLLVTGLGLASLQQLAFAQSARTELVSVQLTGPWPNNASGTLGQFSLGRRIAGAGRFIVFESDASNLVCTDTNSFPDVFIRDRRTGTTMLASRRADGVQGGNRSFEPVITPDARYVAFTSQANNFVAGDTNNVLDIFVRDLQTGIIERVSVSSGGAQSNGTSRAPALSADGRFVSFYSVASNLVANDTNGTGDIFVHDRQSGVTELITVGSAGQQATADSTGHAISADGRYVAFATFSFNLVSEPNAGGIFVRDRLLGTTALVSRGALGEAANTPSMQPDISADGRYVAYVSPATNIVMPDTNAFTGNDVYVYDQLNGVTRRVSVATGGAQQDRDALRPSISVDGRYVAFESWSTNLVPGDTNDQWDIFRHDTLLNVTERVSVTDTGGQIEPPPFFGGLLTHAATISADGSLVLFHSFANNVLSRTISNFEHAYMYGPPAAMSSPGIAFDAASFSVAEAGGPATITVTRTGNVCGTASVDFATSDGTATAGPDYTAASGTLTFEPGETSKTFEIPVHDDALAEPDETVNLTLSNAQEAVLGSPITATLTILNDDTTPNRAPVANDDTFTLKPGSTVPPPGVLANDTDPDGDPLTAVLISQLAHGLVVLNANGEFTYLPSGDFVGTDSFTYQVRDPSGEVSNVATVTIHVDNRRPVANNDTFTLKPGSMVPAPGVLANDMDPDGNGLVPVLISQLTHGLVILNVDGGFTYLPSADFVGTDSFTYQVRDNFSALSNVATVTIHVDNRRPVANDDTFTFRPSAASELALPDVRTNDTDPDGDPLTIVLLTATSNGVLLTGGAIVFRYRPFDGIRIGTDSFTYQLRDSFGALSNVATVTINVVNSPPVANDDVFTFRARDRLIPGDLTRNVVANDSDPDGDPFVHMLMSNPAHGFVMLRNPGLIDYFPQPNFAGTDSFTYRLADSFGALSNIATVTIHVVNTAPVAQSESYFVRPRVARIGAPGVLANDSDADGDPIVARVMSPPATGSLTLEQNGSFIYEGPLGTQSFTYQAVDPFGTVSNIATVTITVVNSPPVARDDVYSFRRDLSPRTFSANVLINDTDADGDPLFALVAQGPSRGSVELDSNGGFSYRSHFHSLGTDQFTYRVSDPHSLGNSATVTFFILGGTLAPGSGPLTPIPGGIGNFTGFNTPVSSPVHIGFRGLGSNGQTGLFAQILGAAPSRIVDLATPIPGGSGTFTAFPEFTFAATPGDPCHEAIFIGAGSNGQSDVYSAPFGAASCSGSPKRLAGLDTPVPGGSGNFAAFSSLALAATPGDPCHEAAFIGTGSGGEQGVYAAPFGGSSCATALETVADSTTAIPGGNGTFASFSSLALAALPGAPCHEAAFIGAGNSGEQGVYSTSFGPSCINAPVRVADTATSIPDGTGTFTGFSNLALAAYPPDPIHEVAFIGTGASGQQGVYKTSCSTGSCAAPSTVADLATRIPEGQGTFNGFSALSASNGHVAFLGTGTGGQKGIYLASTLTKMVDLTETFDGQSITDLHFGSSGLSGNQLVFVATFADGSQGVFRLTLDFPDVNEAPVANHDSYTTTEGVPLTINAAGVLGNDADAEGQSLIAHLVTTAQNGVVTLQTDGSFSYEPNAGFSGSDGFTYRTVDEGNSESNVATVSITVAPIDNAPPVLALPGSIAVTAASASGAVVSFLATANDLIDGPRPVTCAPASGSTFPVGSTTVSCSASDTRGNTSSGTFVVMVSPPTTSTTFAHFTALAQIDNNRGAHDDRFAIEAGFTLRANSNGLQPLTETVVLGLGHATWVIKPGSFKRTALGGFAFSGTIDGSPLAAAILPLGKGKFAFVAGGSRAELTGITNPVTVSLRIGDDAGAVTIVAKIK